MIAVMTIRPDTEEELARRAATGDREAAGELVARLYPPTLSLARRMVRTEEAARDAAQETFLRALRHLPSYSGEHRVSAWIFRILANHLRDTARHQGRAPDPDPPEADAGPLDLVLRAEDLARTREALDRLPEEWKLALLLYYGQGLTSREVAHVLGCSHVAARLRLSRAVRRLREEVAER